MYYFTGKGSVQWLFFGTIIFSIIVACQVSLKVSMKQQGSLIFY